MNTPSDIDRSQLSPPSSRLPAAAPRPFLWSVRREIWENRSLYIVPLIVAGVELFGWTVSLGHLPERRRNALALDPAHARAAIEMPYDIAAGMIIITVFIVGLFYCLDALYGERRDRSILFWKSLPVADISAVLSKITIPLVILPLVSLVIIIVVQFLFLMLSTLALLPSGLAGTTFANFNLFPQSLILLYSLVVIALWHAPIYGWALLISGWVRRATFLWAVLPFLIASVFEKITFDTSYVARFLKDRLLGAGDIAFDLKAGSSTGAHGTIAIDSWAQLTPGRFLAAPGLWLGLVFATAFLVAAIRMRRFRGPL